MAASGPWGAIAQSEGIANDTGAYLRRNSHPQASSESDDPKNEEEDIVDLARQFTQCSAKTGGGSYVNPFGPNNDPELDPMSGQFSQRKWVKTMVGITSRDPERYPERVAGIAFRNLSVHGFGNPLDYQKTFGNYPLEIGGIFSKVTGRGKTKIQILRDFDGLVKSGEMLVVLGRPGSGCTTLLKTLTGETGGFFLDPRSTVNYQGGLFAIG
jgi:ABC-type multidrug transport system fused ATPase/permease subunit